MKTWKDWKTWWHYHWWIALAVLAGAGIFLHLLFMNLRKTEPDYSFAYVGTTPLPEETIAALTEQLERLGEDLNGDGKKVVQFHSYVSADHPEDSAALEQQMAAETMLMADLVDCESYFFLLENPNHFQTSYQALACLDGTCPADTDRTGIDKVFRWANCPVLRGLSLGGYTEIVLGQTASGDSQKRLESLYLGRRCFYNGQTAPFPEGCAALWETLTEGAAP